MSVLAGFFGHIGTQIVGVDEVVVFVESVAPAGHFLVAGVGVGDGEDVVLLLHLEHGARLLGQHGAGMAAHVVVLGGLVGVEHADDGHFGAADLGGAEAHEVLDEGLGVVDFVEVAHEVYHTVDKHDVGLEVADEHLYGLEFLLVGERAEAEGLEAVEVVVQGQLGQLDGAVVDQLHVGGLLLGVHHQHAGHGQGGTQRPPAAAQDGGHHERDGVGLAVFLLGLDGVDVALGKEAYAVVFQQVDLGRVLVGHADAEGQQLVQHLLVGHLLRGGLLQRLGDDLVGGGGGVGGVLGGGSCRAYRVYRAYGVGGAIHLDPPFG